MHTSKLLLCGLVLFIFYSSNIQAWSDDLDEEDRQTDLEFERAKKRRKEKRWKTELKRRKRFVKSSNKKKVRIIGKLLDQKSFARVQTFLKLVPIKIPKTKIYEFEPKWQFYQNYNGQLFSKTKIDRRIKNIRQRVRNPEKRDFQINWLKRVTGYDRKIAYLRRNKSKYRSIYSYIKRIRDNGELELYRDSATFYSFSKRVRQMHIQYRKFKKYKKIGKGYIYDQYLRGLYENVHYLSNYYIGNNIRLKFPKLREFINGETAFLYYVKAQIHYRAGRYKKAMSLIALARSTWKPVFKKNLKAKILKDKLYRASMKKIEGALSEIEFSPYNNGHYCRKHLRDVERYYFYHSRRTKKLTSFLHGLCNKDLKKLTEAENNRLLRLYEHYFKKYAHFASGKINQNTIRNWKDDKVNILMKYALMIRNRVHAKSFSEKSKFRVVRVKGFLSYVSKIQIYGRIAVLAPTAKLLLKFRKQVQKKWTWKMAEKKNKEVTKTYRKIQSHLENIEPFYPFDLKMKKKGQGHFHCGHQDSPNLQKTTE